MHLKTEGKGVDRLCRKIAYMQLHDPYRDELVRELRVFRRSEGEPGSNRMAGLFYLTSMLGDGIPERAFEELMQLREAHGTDPLTPIGAFFFLSGWEVGLGTVDERRRLYVKRHLAGEISTPLRRSNRGIQELCELIRDRDESYRPWAFVSIFQSGNTFQPVLDFNFAHESWAHPSAFINDDEIDLNFHAHKRSDKGEGYTRRFVLPETPLDISVGFAEVMARVRVTWPMPVWPVWSLLSWTADPRILTHMRTFRSRSVEVTLQWWRVTPADQLEGLVRDGAIWTERTDPSRMNLPDSWKRT